MWFYFVFCTASRLNNFQIGTTSTSPAEVAPALDNYDVCSRQLEALEPGRYKTFSCPHLARYVIIQLRGIGILTLCEVEVFEGW